MRLTTVILIATLMQVSAAGFAQKISMSKSNASLKAVLREIKSQSGYNFVYRDKVLADAKPVNINVNQVEVEEVLKQIFEDQDLSYSIDSKTVIVKTKTPSFLDNIIARFSAIDVRGKIIGENDQVLAGATVKVKGTNRVTKSNEKGEFYLAGVEEDAVLEISYVGFKALEIPVKGAAMPLEIKLHVATGELEEVNVTYSTGYQILSKERATGSVTVIDNKKFNEQVGTDVLSRLPVIANSLTYLPSDIQKNQLVLRGVQTFGGPIGPLVVVDDFPYDGDINNINPNDVESISLLKDAAAASIWGAKAGNGVIVITTKKGRLNQKVGASITSNLTIINKPDLFYLKRANSSELIDFEKFLFSNGYYDAELEYSPVNYQSPVIDILEKGRKKLISETEVNSQLDALRNNDIRHDFNRYVYEQGVNQQYSVSLQGGSNNNGWLLSAGFDKNKTQLDAFSERGTVRFNNNYKPIKQLTISAGINISYRNGRSGKRGFDELIGNVNRVQSYTQLIDASGVEVPLNQYRKAYVDTAGKGKLLNWNYYPLQDFMHSVENTRAKSIVGDVALNYEVLPGLNVSVKYKLQNEQTGRRLLNDENSFFTRNYINGFTTINSTTQAVSRPVPLGSILDVDDVDIISNNLRGQLNWEKSWGESTFSGIIGSELNSVVKDISRDRYYGYNEELKLSSTVDYLRSYPSYISQFGSLFIQNRFLINRQNYRLSAQYAKFDYTYDQRYSLSASARKDGANLFGVSTNDKWNLLWSVGAAWNLSRESFYNSTLLPNLKIRVTYGFGGNVLQGVSSKTVLNYSGINEYTGGQIARVSTFSNPDLRWEKIKTTNLGLDFGSASNRITGSIEYYSKKGIDLYNNTDIDRTLGLRTGRIQTNNGSMKAHGVDITINSINVNRQLKWSSDISLSYYTDKVVNYYTPSVAAYNFVNGAIPAVGYSRFSLFRYKWAGLSSVDGAPQGYLNGKVSTDYYALYGDSSTFADLSYKGSATPKYFGSLGNTISFKNFSLTARVTYFLNYSFQRPTFDYNTAITNRVLHNDFTRRWIKPGDEVITDVPALDYMDDGIKTYFYLNSDALNTRGDHIRLQYVNLSYIVSRKQNQKLLFSNIKLSVIANDLGILWRANKFGIDPMSINSIPTPRSFVFSVNANF
jgi:TonB-linked SusC/RagA family outer membrane protein